MVIWDGVKIMVEKLPVLDSFTWETKKFKCPVPWLHTDKVNSPPVNCSRLLLYGSESSVLRVIDDAPSVSPAAVAILRFVLHIKRSIVTSCTQTSLEC